MSRRSLRAGLLALASAIGGTSGCAAAQRPPPPSTVALAGAPVVWRDWSTQGHRAICDAEPNFLLDELTLVNSALQRFLNLTSSQDPRDWPESKISAVEGERRELPRVLGPHAKNLELLQRCELAARAGFPFVRQRGTELIAAVREREQLVEQLAEKARSLRMLAAWKDSVREQRELRRGACPARARGPVVYLAWRDEKGVAHWEFCDGSEATQVSGAAMSLERSVRALSAPRPFEDERYLATAREWPESRVLAAPPAR